MKHNKILFIALFLPSVFLGCADQKKENSNSSSEKDNPALSEKKETKTSSQETLLQIREKTMELLETTDPNDVDYITLKMIKSDLMLTDDDEIGKDEDMTIRSTKYGHNMRYSNRIINGRTVQVYVFNNGGNWTSPSAACGNSHTGWIRQDQYNHWKIGNCSSRDAKLKFTSR